MKPFKKFAASALALAAGATVLTACGSPTSTEAEIASENISTECEMFNCARRVVFMNNVTGEYLLEIQGRCNIQVDTAETQLEVTCKVDGGHKKHFLGLNDTTTYAVEQVNPSIVSEDHYKVVFKPSAIVPEVEIR
ncbi:hypothetical protein SEA_WILLIAMBOONE_113 [Gordonia phage WilliamBoone]|nr:hypothetical protein SEA_WILLIAMBOONE_113 [Gordonia phage WilliamBoone]